jgi:ElaB/YqjD/DUF883 family membrane-anchored ribosome-binding protein
MNTVPTEKIVTDMKVLIGDMEELIKATAAQTGEKLAEARSRAQQALANAKVGLARAEAAATEQAKIAARAVDQSVHQHPWSAFGVSAVITFAIGLLIGRR